MAKVMFLGPLPPPMHGFSNINAMMLERLNAVADVAVFNRSPNLNIRNCLLRKFAALVTTCLQLVGFTATLATNRAASLYAGFSGGLGQLLDMPFLLLARVRGVPIYLHHHSFAYLNKPNLLTRVCLAAAGNARQIVLCSAMGEQLALRYGVHPRNIRQLSNSGFLPEVDPATNAQGSRSYVQEGALTGVLLIGFLGNITTAKGIFTFLDVVRQAREMGLNVRAAIAGPVDEAIEERFFCALAEVPYATYLGGVYGTEKRKFFESIDILLFPTDYVNEAEPVTIWEALAFGVEVVATDRGCIRGVLAEKCGKCSSRADFLKDSLIAIKRQIGMSFDSRRKQRKEICEEFLQKSAISRDRLDFLVEELSTVATGVN